MNEKITIPQKFMGPPGMGNGGYVAGLLARHFSEPVTVRLHRPAPLDRPLSLQNGSAWHLLEEERLIATAKADPFDLALPDQLSFAELEQLATGYPAGALHPFPHCFVCGPARQVEDGLCIFPAAVPGRNLVVAIWQPYAGLADADGWVKPQYLWAALDCPGGIAAVKDRPRPIVLGQISGQLLGRLRPEERVLVLGWEVAANGRKHTMGTALLAESGELLGKARAIWIELKL